MQKNRIKIWNVNVDNIIISKLIETKKNSKYLIRYLNEAIRPFVLILPKMSGFKDNGGDKNKNNKLMSLHINDDTLFEKHKTIWTKIEDLKNIESDTLPVFDNRYQKNNTKMWW